MAEYAAERSRFCSPLTRIATSTAEPANRAHSEASTTALTTSNTQGGPEHPAALPAPDREPPGQPRAR